MEYQDVRVPLGRVSDIFDVAVVEIVMAGERGKVEIGHDDCIAMSECERWAMARGAPKVEMVRALSVLPRFATVYTTGGVATVLGVSTASVRKLMDNGTLAAYHIPNTSSGEYGERRMTRRALAEYLSSSPCAQADKMGVRMGTQRRKKAASVAEDKPGLTD